MRIPEEMVLYFSREIVDRLLAQKMIEIDSPKEKIVETVKVAMLEELRLEERLDEEVKKILATHEKNMDKDGVDYRKMFLMIKKKIIRDRELIL
jgi:hypothetical protein